MRARLSTFFAGHLELSGNPQTWLYDFPGAVHAALFATDSLYVKLGLIGFGLRRRVLMRQFLGRLVLDQDYT